MYHKNWEEYMEEFAKRLKEIIEEKKLTRYRIAKDIKISASTILNYLNANSKPDSTKLELLANRLGVNTEWLLSGAGPKYRLEEPKHLYQKSNQAKDTSILEQLLEVAEKQNDYLKQMIQLLKKELKRK